MSIAASPATSKLETAVLPVDASKLCLSFSESKFTTTSLDDWTLDLDDSSPDTKHLQRAADELRYSDVPVAFPTETVYGLGADATRSAAVQGIFRAKQRPPDNPLIVHVHSLNQLRSLLKPSQSSNVNFYVKDPERVDRETLQADKEELDPIPDIYKPLIHKFWPGPLTMIFQKPRGSSLAPEVTAGLETFGARMPSGHLALALIKLADVPVAAPSANASSKPSPTAAEHVKYDLDGRISTILDGGPCAVGVESTVVDGLSDPPCILRPGGVSLEQLRACPGWEGVTKAYKETSESGGKPRAPGMKYRHYSPTAPVVLYEYQEALPTSRDIVRRLAKFRRIGIIRTKTWPVACGLNSTGTQADHPGGSANHILQRGNVSSASMGSNTRFTSSAFSNVQRFRVQPNEEHDSFDVAEIFLGEGAERIAQGLFAALRRLDQEEVDAILVEGIDDDEGDTAAAVMNRLRKAAETRQPK